MDLHPVPHARPGRRSHQDRGGDVIDVSSFDTTLWEVGGPYLSTDHPSGRIIKFPNSTVLIEPVYNYSNEDGWLDAIVRYLVDPKEAGRMTSQILRKMLKGLNAEPGRVLFPKGR